MEKTVGILGGGQLGRMMCEAASRLNLKVVCLDAEGAPAKQINCHPDHVNGSFRDAQAIRRLAERCDVLTTEIEHVDTYALEELANGTHTTEDWQMVKVPRVDIQPGWETIRTIQDKYLQKEHLTAHQVSTARSLPLAENTLEALQECRTELKLPFMLKSRTEAYDGRGNHPVKTTSDFAAALEALGNRQLYAEEWQNFKQELAVMIVKTTDDPGEWQSCTLAFPVVETVHEDSICKLVYAPARAVSPVDSQNAQDLARKAVSTFRGKGVFGVEMFLLDNGKLLVNEIAPRPHNSGHYTIEACRMSQFEAHLRAILELPIPPGGLEFLTGDTKAIMLNILGGVSSDTHLRAAEQAFSVPGAKIHLYGKGVSRPGRKMGHITLISDSMHEAEDVIQPLISTVDLIRAERSTPSNIERKSESSAPPLVAVTMGSDSDRNVLAPGIKLLKDLGIPHSVTITSAHRTPQRMVAFAEKAASKGIKVIIAAAGGAAHLPGMVAANTWLPVIGVPVKASNLEGLDSLLSIVQMPRGCPVASVAINNSVNAAQLAVRILSVDNAAIRRTLQAHLDEQTRGVEEKAKRMEDKGFEDYDVAG